MNPVFIFSEDKVDQVNRWILPQITKLVPNWIYFKKYCVRIYYLDIDRLHTEELYDKYTSLERYFNYIVITDDKYKHYKFPIGERYSAKNYLNEEIILDKISIDFNFLEEHFHFPIEKKNLEYDKMEWVPVMEWFVATQKIIEKENRRIHRARGEHRPDTRKSYQYEDLRDEVLKEIPPHFRIFFSQLTWEHKHFKGYEQMYSFLFEVIKDFKEPLEKYTKHISKHANDLGF